MTEDTAMAEAAMPEDAMAEATMTEMPRWREAPDD